MCVTRVLMKIFNTRSWDIIEQCQLMFGMLPVADQVFMKKVRFLLRFTHSENLIYSLFVSNHVFATNTRRMRLIYMHVFDALPLDMNRFRLFSWLSCYFVLLYFVVLSFAIWRIKLYIYFCDRQTKERTDGHNQHVKALSLSRAAA